MTHERAIDRRPRRRRIELIAQFGAQRAWPPARVASSQHHQPRFDHGVHLVGTGVGPVGLRGQSLKATVGVLCEPTMQGSAIDPITGGDRGD